MEDHELRRRLRDLAVVAASAVATAVVLLALGLVAKWYLPLPYSVILASLVWVLGFALWPAAQGMNAIGEHDLVQAWAYIAFLVALNVPWFLAMRWALTMIHKLTAGDSAQADSAGPSASAVSLELLDPEACRPEDWMVRLASRLTAMKSYRRHALIAFSSMAAALVLMLIGFLLPILPLPHQLMSLLMIPLRLLTLCLWPVSGGHVSMPAGLSWESWSFRLYLAILNLPWFHVLWGVRRLWTRLARRRSAAPGSMRPTPHS